MPAERLVQFWQITNEFGEPIGEDFPFPKLVKDIGKLTGPSRYTDLRDGMRILGQKAPTNVYSHLILHRIRRDNLPSIEDDGSFTDVPLKSRQNIAESTHLIFLPNNVLGVLFNQDGPRVTRLPEYLDQRFKVKCSVRPVLNRDTARRLSEMGTFTSVELSIPTSRIALLDDDTNNPTKIPAALREMAEVSLSKTLHLKLIISGSEENRAPGLWRSFVERIVGGSQINLFSHLKVHARSDEPGIPGTTIDFVEEQLVLRETVEFENDGSRRIKRVSARRAILAAYLDLKDEIDTTVTNLGSTLSSNPNQNI